MEFFTAGKKGECRSVKVLMIGPARSVHGGISGVINNYYEAGLDQKIDLSYIGTMKEGSKITKLLCAGTAYVQFLLKVQSCDIVHVNVASDMSYIRKSFFIWAAKRAGKKIVIHQHGGDFEGYYSSLPEKKKEKVKETLSMGDVFLVLAPNWKEFFGKLIDDDKIIVFPDSISIPENFRKEYGQKRILFLGRICKEKGVGELLAAMEEVRKIYPECELCLGGIWEDKSLEEQVRRSGTRIKYLGWIAGEEKKRYLRECDIFVLPSYFEGQSVAILEAMAHSCAVAASDVGGIPQMIIDGETGVLFRPKDKEALKAGLLRLLSDPSLCKKLGANARNKVENEFSIETNMKELIDIYGKI